MATVIPACCAARRAFALRGLMDWLKVGRRVPSISMATRRTGGCMQLVYREQVSDSKRSKWLTPSDIKPSLYLQHLRHATAGCPAGVLQRIMGKCNERVLPFTM